MGLKVYSKSFQDGDLLPLKYTIEGKNTNPPLSISEIPTGTKSLAILTEDNDPHSPRAFAHWLVKNIPPTVTEIEEDNEIGTLVKNEKKLLNYIGPAPSTLAKGMQKYHFKVYALPVETFDADNKVQFVRFCAKNCIEQAKITGLYQNPKAKEREMKENQPK
jgi:Raf kinase inhibitor-like YbhB/YbcL family protein